MARIGLDVVGLDEMSQGRIVRASRLGEGRNIGPKRLPSCGDGIVLSLRIGHVCLAFLFLQPMFADATLYGCPFVPAGFELVTWAVTVLPEVALPLYLVPNLVCVCVCVCVCSYL